jgi:hypothetical protein
MRLSEMQQTFAHNAALLILKMSEAPYACTFGEALRTQEMADLYAKQGKGIKNSLHLKKLAIDLNLFKGGEYLSTSEAHRPFGEWWEALDPDNRWGGRFGDGNHYSMTDDGKHA